MICGQKNLTGNLWITVNKLVQTTVGRVLSVSPVVGIGTPPPLLQQAGVPPPPPFGTGGGQTRLRLKGWGSPNSNEGTFTVVLYIYKYFVVQTKVFLLLLAYSSPIPSPLSAVTAHCCFLNPSSLCVTRTCMAGLPNISKLTEDGNKIINKATS